MLLLRRFLLTFIFLLLCSRCSAQSGGFALSIDLGEAAVHDRGFPILIGAGIFKDIHLTSSDSEFISIYLRPSIGIGYLYLNTEIVSKILLKKEIYLIAGVHYITLRHTWVYVVNRTEWLTSIHFVYGIGFEGTDTFGEFQLTTNASDSQILGTLFLRFGFRL